MNLGEAIKNNKKIVRKLRLWDKNRKAIQLGIEALERELEERKISEFYVPLPSETEGE